MNFHLLLSRSRCIPRCLLGLMLALATSALIAPRVGAGASKAEYNKATGPSAAAAVSSSPATEAPATAGSSSTAPGKAKTSGSVNAPEPPAAPACPMGILPKGNGGDIVINDVCVVEPAEYHYHNMNIIGNGKLTFMDGKTDLWAESILVEGGGTMVAGTPCNPIKGPLTIHLWGENQGTNGTGILCVETHCGVPDDKWGTNGSKPVVLPGDVTDFFYDYMPLRFDGGDKNAYFGYKVLGVAWDGALTLYGAEGSSKCENLKVSDSGQSWARLDASVTTGSTQLTLDRTVDWRQGDQIVLTTSDYVADHSEQLTVESVAPGENANSVVALSSATPVQFPHNGEKFSLARVPKGIGPDPVDPENPDAPRFVETRAAVALLSRSIRIVSEGDKDGELFAEEPPTYSFGGHTVFRQGFRAIDLRGVEFDEMGQGGRIMHYPVHFHMARKTPPVAQIMDCSIHDSMTRWITIHATQGVTLARNVGYKSIGHGYYFEDGTETDNKLYSNIGILARAAVQNETVNPRSVPGILGAEYPPWNDPHAKQEHVPFHSDADHPTIFWIMNAYNDFEYNMATGADTCGACYWLVPGYISGDSRGQKWESYAGEQSRLTKAASAPLYKFLGNYCSTAMNAFNTIGNEGPCIGVVNQNPAINAPQLPEVKNELAPPIGSTEADGYYPKVDTGGGHFGTKCPDDGSDCSKPDRCNLKDLTNCVITLIDRFTSSYNWAETNFGAIWLRPQWYLFLNSAVTDVQNGGLSMITGGGYTDSDTIPGHWALAYKSVFIGNTQDAAVNPYASNAGPFNPDTPLNCATKTNGAPAGNVCMSKEHGITMPISNFGVSQRLMNIYDGPIYQDSSAYLDIEPTLLTGCRPSPPPQGGDCSYTRWMYGQATGVPRTRKECYLPNAAIGWKQPNGFYYPPAFHSANLFFDNVPIRHYVIEPLFIPGTFKTNVTQTFYRYCNWNDQLFNNFTDIDRQTELNDDDGTLTGLNDTISVNQDPFFNAPSETDECASDFRGASPPATAKTSPYDYVTSVVYPACGPHCDVLWNRNCASPNCYGVPLYREDVNMSELGTKPSIRMMAQDSGQRSNLTLNNGSFYIDTTVSEAAQRQQSSLLNVFQPSKTYYVFLVFAKPTTKQTYSLYVGPNFDYTISDQFSVVHVKLPTDDYKFEDVPWLEGIWTRSYDKDLGVLTVTMDMTKDPEFKLKYLAAKSAHCKPASFCKLQDSGDCGCTLNPADGLYDNCQKVCSTWATRDVTCPEDGCYGFKITLSPEFTTGPKMNLPPKTKCYPADEFTKDFVPVSEEKAGTCFYKTPPPPKVCKE